MTQIDYKKAFSKLSHIKALSHDQKFDQIVQNLIKHALFQKSSRNTRNDTEITALIKDIYGISVREQVVRSNVDKLLDNGELIKDPQNKEIDVTSIVHSNIAQRISEALSQENNVKAGWFDELRGIHQDIDSSILNILWDCIKQYLCGVFEQHGIQTLHLLNPNAKNNESDLKSLHGIIQEILKGNSNISQELLTSSINQFIVHANELRTNYISTLADSTFTSFALTSDAETVNFLNQRYHDMRLFLDTNFIFGILGLHKNSEDASALELLEELKKNRIPFTLCYHPETLSEFRRAFDARALNVTASRWTRESSRVAIEVDGLSPIEELYHEQNIDSDIDPAVFLEKYDHVDLILKDLGLTEFTPNGFTSDEEHVAVESDIEKYTTFYEAVPHRKNKTYSGFKHDIIVLREVRKLNPKKTKFLDSKAFFISSDYILAKFEKDYYVSNWEINYVVSPSVFLQLIRPFFENDNSSNKRFIDTFSIPEFRSFEIDYSQTRSKTLQILNDNYHSASFETKVHILRDQVILDKLSKANDDSVVQSEIIENYLATANKILNQEKDEALVLLEEESKEKEKIEKEKDAANNTIAEKSQQLTTLKIKHQCDELEKDIVNKIAYKKVVDDSIVEVEKIIPPLNRAIESKYKSHLFFISLIPVFFILIMSFLIYFLTWDKMEPFTYVISLLAVVGGYLFLAIKGESFNPTQYLDSYKKEISSQKFNEFGVSILELEKKKVNQRILEGEIQELKDQLGELKKVPNII